MRKRFNDTGNCNPSMHYMVDTTNKLTKISDLVYNGLYFTMNKPYQFGKTTNAFFLSERLMKQDNYLVLQISFEGIGDTIFEEENTFCRGFCEMIADELDFLKESELHKLFMENQEEIDSFKKLSNLISQFVELSNSNVVLIIDEVDKSSNNQLFLSFLGMLRSKYLNRNKNRDITFHSVMLIGVHDVKTLKLKISSNSSSKLNSPWNIAVDFKVDMSFNPQEIATMLIDYTQDKNIEMDIPLISDRIYYYTSGYPYLVSKMCKTVDEEILPDRQTQNWTVTDIDDAFKKLVYEGYTTTLFDHIFKSLENNEKLYDEVFNISINGELISFNINDPIVNIGSLYGIFSDDEGHCKIHNRIFEQRIYNYMMLKQMRKRRYDLPSHYSYNYFNGNDLNLKAVLLKFQQFMKENHSDKDEKFVEREGRLLFLSFLKPIINGKGFDFKEPNVADERRMDIVITYNEKRYVVELKIWRDNIRHQKGLKQLCDYLDTYSLQKGYLLIFDFRKSKTYKDETIKVNGKEIFAAWV